MTDDRIAAIAAIILSALVFGFAFLAILAYMQEPDAEQQKRIDQLLPSGCRLIDLGKYQSIDHLVVIDCASGTTVNGIKRVWAGKIYYERTFATFKEKDASHD